MLFPVLQAGQMCFGFTTDWIMLGFVFLLWLAGCSAKVGYDYGTPDYQLEQNELPVSDQYDTHADFHTHFYAFEAPYEASDESERVARKIAASAQKHLQVVFIKAPQNKALEGAVHALAQQTQEDKTAIYVLNKQTDGDELAQQLASLRAHHKHKPIVNFVKYKTEAEAKQAQQLIRAHYSAAGQTTAQPQLPELPQTSYLPVEPPQPSYLPAEPPQPSYLPAVSQSSYLPSRSVPSALPALPMTPALSTELPATPVLPPKQSYLPELPTEPNKSSYLQVLAALQELQASQAELPPSPPKSSYLPAQTASSELSSKTSYLQALAALKELPTALPAAPAGPALPELPAAPSKSNYLQALAALQELEESTALSTKPSYLPALPEQPQSSYLPPLPVLPTLPPPASSYLPQLPNYSAIAASYQTDGNANAGLIDLPEQSQLPASPYDLDVDVRAAATNRVDFRLNERQPRGKRLVFPSDGANTRSDSRYLAAAQLANRRRRRANH